jgi:phospholipid-binding lipoprotein MlaA
MNRLITLILACLLVGCATTAAPPEQRIPADPWEPFNRSMYEFNRGVDKAVLRPVARGYDAITPKPVRTGIGNFFRNLGSPVVMINLLLQGRGQDFEQEFQRFFVNTVYGVGGIFDLADRANIADVETDFGQTLHTWGWEDSRFLMLPLLGPSTVRDGVGTAVDSTKDNVWQRGLDSGRWGLQALRIVDRRAGLLPLEPELARAFDEYALVRDGYLQRRRYFLEGEEARAPDYESFLDEGDWDDEPL